jgi:hypothetical protein
MRHTDDEAHQLCSTDLMPQFKCTAMNHSTRISLYQVLTHTITQTMQSKQTPCTCYRVIYIKDPSDQEWSNVKDALKQAGMWQLVLETSFTWNQPYGPWEGASWFKAHEEAFKQVQFVADHIAVDNSQVREQGESFSDNSEMLLEESNKDNKISLTREFNWATAAAVNLPQWHAKLHILLHQAISLGLIGHISEIRGLESTKPLCSMESVAGVEPDKKRQKIEAEEKETQGPGYNDHGSTVHEPDNMEKDDRDDPKDKPNVPGKKDKVSSDADSVSKMRMTCQALSQRM